MDLRDFNSQEYFDWIEVQLSHIPQFENKLQHITNLSIALVGVKEIMEPELHKKAMELVMIEMNHELCQKVQWFADRWMCGDKTQKEARKEMVLFHDSNIELFVMFPEAQELYQGHMFHLKKPN